MAAGAPAPTSTPTALVALDAKTGKRVWHYQMIHHDLWEYDNVGPATLGDITVNGKRIKAVMQPNKNGYLYVLDRTNGEPVWPIDERPVADVERPGEQASATQPIPTKPPPFDRQGVAEDDLIDFTPELSAAALEFVKPLRARAALHAAVAGRRRRHARHAHHSRRVGRRQLAHRRIRSRDRDVLRGLADAARHPRRSEHRRATPKRRWITRAAAVAAAAARRSRQTPAGTVAGLGPQVQGLPIVKGRYGRITAYNLRTGELAWMAANGDGPRNHPLLKDLNLPPLGVPNRPAPLLTKTLLFLGEGSDAVIGTPQVDWAWGKKFRAYDKATGKVMAEIELPSGTTGADDLHAQGQAVHHRPGRREGSSGRVRRAGHHGGQTSNGRQM